jgi:hypothetical protein
VQSVVEIGESENYVVATLAHNRFCFCKGACHKSNHVYLVIDCKQSTVHQKCHDIDCRGFRSAAYGIPENLVTQWEELRGRHYVPAPAMANDCKRSSPIRVPNSSDPTLQEPHVAPVKFPVPASSPQASKAEMPQSPSPLASTVFETEIDTDTEPATSTEIEAQTETEVEMPTDGEEQANPAAMMQVEPTTQPTTRPNHAASQPNTPPELSTSLLTSQVQLQTFAGHDIAPHIEHVQNNTYNQQIRSSFRNVDALPSPSTPLKQRALPQINTPPNVVHPNRKRRHHQIGNLNMLDPQLANSHFASLEFVLPIDASSTLAEVNSSECCPARWKKACVR